MDGIIWRVFHAGWILNIFMLVLPPRFLDLKRHTTA